MTDRLPEWETATQVGGLRTTLSFAVGLADPVTGERPSGDVAVALADSPATAVENPSGFHLFLDLATDPVTLTVDGGDRYFDERRTVYHSQSPPDDASDVTEALDPSEPVEITLTPTPAYRFAAGTTRLRGTVTTPDGDGGDEPVPGATVSLGGFEPTARTTGTGEYALYVPATAEDVIGIDGTRLVKDVPENGRRTPGDGGSSGDGGGGNSDNSGGGNSDNSGGPAGNGPANGGNGGPAGNDSQPPDPELTVDHPDHRTFSRAIPVEAGVLTRYDVELR